MGEILVVVVCVWGKGEGGGRHYSFVPSSLGARCVGIGVVIFLSGRECKLELETLTATRAAVVSFT